MRSGKLSTLEKSFFVDRCLTSSLRLGMSVTLKRMRMKILIVPILATALALTAAAQDVKEFLGRWDMTVTPATGNPYPQWMELTENGGKIEGRVQPRGGA